MKPRSNSPVRVGDMLRDMYPTAAFVAPRPVIGIDPDSMRLGVAQVSASGKLSKTKTIPRRNRHGEFDPGYHAAIRGMFEWAARHKALVCCESAFLGKNPETFGELREVAGELGLVAREYGVVIVKVPPVTWMRSTLGITKAREAIKAASMKAASAWATESGCPLPATEHEADAANIAAWAVKQTRSALEHHGPAAQRTASNPIPDTLKMDSGALWLETKGRVANE